MNDDNDRLRKGKLSKDPAADTVPIPGASQETPDSDYVPFPTEALPEPASSFVKEAARALGCDEAYVALPLITGLAGSIGNTRRIKLKANWFESSVVWSGIVGASGTLKSPAMEIALAPLQALEAKSIRVHRKRMEVYERARESGKTLRAPPALERILCSDVTVEALVSLHVNSPRGLILTRDELSGWMRGFDQYRRAHGSDVAHYLSMHGARPILFDRKKTGGETILVPRAAVSITGGIQPGILKRTLGDEHLENGLAARLLLVSPPRRPRYWTDDEISPLTAARLSQLYDYLRALDFMTSADGDKVPVDLPLTPSGKSAWIEFYNRHGKEQAQVEDNLASAFSKLEGYCARFALIVHLVRCFTSCPKLENEAAIDALSIQSGVDLTTWFAYETERTYRALGIHKGAGSVTNLIFLIRRRGGHISVRELMQSCRQYRGSAESSHAALQNLVDNGFGKWLPRETGKKGRPSEVFELHPEGDNTGNGNKTLPGGRRGSS